MKPNGILQVTVDAMPAGNLAPHCKKTFPFAINSNHSVSAVR